MGKYVGIGICALIGVGILIFALKRIIETIVFIRASNKTSGTIVGLATARNSDGGTTYLPMVEFKTTGEKAVRFTSTVAASPPSYKVGEAVEVRFLTKNPQSAKINSFSEIWMLTLILALIGTVCLAIALMLFLS